MTFYYIFHCRSDAPIIVVVRYSYLTRLLFALVLMHMSILFTWCNGAQRCVDG